MPDTFQAQHGADCSCCQGGKPTEQSLDELAFLKSACAAAQAGNCAKLAAMLQRNPDLISHDGTGGVKTLLSLLFRLSL